MGLSQKLQLAGVVATLTAVVVALLKEEIVKLYYDYAKGAGNGALLPGRKRSSFSFEPHWRTRPWPPQDKYGHSASDAELGLS